jgi:hypothetical protein
MIKVEQIAKACNTVPQRAERGPQPEGTGPSRSEMRRKLKQPKKPLGKCQRMTIRTESQGGCKFQGQGCRFEVDGKCTDSPCRGVEQAGK